ncbi:MULTISPECIES: hypothetical protein [Moorena]|uniref:hypothetical protein n=1 Tax=Moorena TaxID=1155738 RepID=UPI0002E936DA|nr:MULTISPECIES: hypothetical protein [Moorena]NEQ15247.1 hypothetical protein [Moorena sp. SIO3E2]NEP37085.1 hypothetical protein [Moorena sp. SIO3B2]NEP69471.1 hypothetical protein [Moorena sp. SIO3A5]NER89611.1 hypothetical protein [Moorena sp. SIO3A2]NES41977.1 hypothetical protein [Moorena sp. SIO2C4]
MILRVGARLQGRFTHPWVAPVEWASCLELAFCQFHAYFRAGRMPTLLLSIT